MKQAWSPLIFFFTLLVAPAVTPSALAKSTGGYTYYQKLTGEDSDSADKSRWDAIYQKTKGYVFGRDPAPFLVDNLSLLPIGRTLDIAMGEGRNAVYMAKKGYEVTGVDISDVAIRKAKRMAKENNVRITAILADLNKYQIAPNSYDVILVFYYLQRSLTPQIMRALKPGGVLVFENYTKDQVKYDHAENADYLLAKGELKTMFKGLEILKYREVDTGQECVASLVARKPK